MEPETGMTAPTIPTRHGANRAEAERMARPLLWYIGDRKRAQPSPEQWQRLGEALLEGDPLMDSVVDWMDEVGASTGRRDFNLALNQGVDSIKQVSGPLAALFSQVDPIPDWLDHDRLERGLNASALAGKTGMRVLRDLGLMAGYQASAINRTLIMTGTLEKGAARRLAETTKWWLDCTRPGGLDRFGDGFKTTLRVRLIHALVRRHISARTEWDCALWGLPVNQLDMQATYLAFSVLYLQGQRLMGTLISSRESEDIMHLWRYIGWLMGVKPAFLCDSEMQGSIALYRNLISQATADETSKQLGRSLMDEPLHRQYPNFRRLRGHWEKQVHLSICRWFMGKAGMKALGLPEKTLPWYPLAFAPLNALWCLSHRTLPGGRKRLITKGRQAQERQLETLFGTHRPDILSSALPGT